MRAVLTRVSSASVAIEGKTVGQINRGYLILLGCESYDVPFKSKDDSFQKDNSDETYAIINGNPGVTLSFEKQTGYSTGEVTDRLLDKFGSINGVLNASPAELMNVENGQYKTLYNMQFKKQETNA